MMRALDLYAGAGGVTAGLMRAGFVVHGVDLKPPLKRADRAIAKAEPTS